MREEGKGMGEEYLIVHSTFWAVKSPTRTRPDEIL